MKGRWNLHLVSVVLVVALLLASGSALAELKTVTVLNTSDFHGNLLVGQKDKAANRLYGGEAIVAAYVAKYRAEDPLHTLLVDEGDVMQGPAISTALRGKPTVETYNAMGYTAAALGNHEFDWGLDVLRAREADAIFPFLAANIYDKATGQQPDFVLPYTITDVGGVSVGLIGLTTPDTPNITMPVITGGLEFRNPVATVNALVPELRAKGAQVIIVLAHMGGDQAKDGTITGELADLAKGVQGVDLILGGHSHTTVAGSVNGVPVQIPYYQGRALGVSKIVFDTETKKVTSVTTKVEPTWGDAVQPDPTVQAIIDRFNKDLAPVMGEELATAPAEIVRNYDDESALGNLVADVMLIQGKGQIAFTNAGGLRTDVPAGPITLGKVWEVIPFDNTVVTMDLTGAQVIGLLRNKAKGMPQTSGVKFTWKAIPGNNNEREIVGVYLADGTKLDPAATYKVVTNDFMAAGGDNYTFFKQGKNVVNTQINVRDALIAYLKGESAAGRQIAPKVEGRATQVQ